MFSLKLNLPLSPVTHSRPTLLQVVSPLTESVLGETLLTVTEEKVSITQLQAQVVASLTLSLRPSPGSSHTILATAAAQQTLSFLKQVTGCPTGQPGGLECGRRTCRFWLRVPPDWGSDNGRSVYSSCSASLPHPIALPSAQESGQGLASCTCRLEAFQWRVPSWILRRPVSFSSTPRNHPHPSLDPHNYSCPAPQIFQDTGRGLR